MRFLFCDRIDHIIKGDFISGIKAFSLSEDFLTGHFEERPLVPGTLFIETMAQFLGWLIFYSHDFTLFPIISLVDSVSVRPDMAPGFSAQITARLLSTQNTDSMGSAEIWVNGKCVAKAGRMIYTHMEALDSAALKEQFNTMAGHL